MATEQEQCTTAIDAIAAVMVATKQHIDKLLVELNRDTPPMKISSAHKEMARSIVADAFCGDCIESIISEFVARGSGFEEYRQYRKIVEELRNCGSW